ncbi:hypothetical protein EPUL_006568 [Erysiphe pulchra]|uniref:Uncharacterized protein n=1 Tax=Erysiphe pulchra TaxID=225359 RepID=A0A2S4PS91_9PEZI|nr:hypothetical protein EPUL_006568 [Erysiphe pulchra]
MDKQDDENLFIDVETGEPPNNIINTDPCDEDFPPLTGVSDIITAKITQNNGNINETKNNATSLMDAINSLLDPPNPFLKNFDEDHHGVGADFLALLADGASRAMRGERIYTSLQKTTSINSKVSNPSWAEKAGELDNGQKISLKKQDTREIPPRGQSKEDRRVIIRIGPDHKARKISSFKLHQKIQLLIPDRTLIADVWTVPSGVAILAPTPAKAAALLQFKEAIENRFDDAYVESQKTWVTFVVGPIPKKSRSLDGIQDLFDGLLHEELASNHDVVPIRHVSWTCRFLNEKPF